MNRRSPLLPFVLGLCLVYVAERSLGESARLVTLGVGGLLVAIGYGLALFRLSRVWRPAGNESRRAASSAVGAYSLILLALGLYALQATALGGAATAEARTLLMVVWPFLLLFGLLPAFAIELALAEMALAPSLEDWRVRLAARSARVVVMALVVFAGANFAASRWNRKVDLSYLRTTAPSAATLTLVRELAEPVDFILFYPPGNDVALQLAPYFHDIAAASGKAAVRTADQALEPDLARELKVRQNGALVVKKGAQSETVQIGLELEQARGMLRKLDTEVQSRLLKLVRPPRTVYFVTGHMERDYSPANSDKRLGVSELKALIEALGFSVARLGLADGLGKEVPADAGLLVLAGPLAPLATIERDAIKRYLEGGGRMLALFEPEAGVFEEELLASVGVKVGGAFVASERSAIAIEGRGSSPFNFATASVSSHPSTTTVFQNSGRMAIAFLGAGAVEIRDDAPSTLSLTAIVHAPTDAFEDKNKNGRFDPESEKRRPRDLALAVSRPLDKEKAKAGERALRAVVLADADVAGNGLLRNPGNGYFMLDLVKWLAGEDALVGPPSTEEDTPIVHKRDDDVLWFYGTSFVVPAAVLAVGLVVQKRSRRRKAS